MKLNEIFSYMEPDNIKVSQGKYGVSIPDNFTFSDVNIIIGENGSGKTRFLNYIKEMYNLNNENASNKGGKTSDIIYGYFPALLDRIVPNNQDYSLPIYTLYEYIKENNVTFNDFFQEIEIQGIKFIENLLICASISEKEKKEKTFTSLAKFFNILTGKQICIKDSNIYVQDGSSDIELSTKLIEFSPGELMLFYMAIFLAIQKRNNNRIIILDEPELHLHPKALIEFIRFVANKCSYKQLWIATHSLYIIPHLQFENIVYISKGVITPRSSKTYPNILTDLLGNQEEKTLEFFSSMSQWQYCEYLAECFENPEVIDNADPNDEQVKLFIECYSMLKKSGFVFRMLDCGGGIGRLGHSLKSAQLLDYINYEIYDKKDYNTGFIFHNNLRNINEKYDCIVMMNFLHEVDPNAWNDVFAKVYSCMKKKNSYILFIEVANLIKGEMPNKFGHLVLGKEELEVLFNHELSEIKLKENQKSICILIPREYIPYVDKHNVLEAIKHLQDRMFKEIKKFRKENEDKCNEVSFYNGRKYAFLLQQYINAKLFIEKYS